MNKHLMTSDYTDVDGIRWHKSSYSGQNNNCIEHGSLRAGSEGIRDTKDSARRSKIVVSSSAWSAFVGAAKDGSL